MIEPDFQTIAEIKRANRDSGGHFFEPAKLTHLRAKHLLKVYYGRYFVESTQPDLDEPRKFYVREVDAHGRVEMNSENTNAYDTISAALIALKRRNDERLVGSQPLGERRP